MYYLCFKVLLLVFFYVEQDVHFMWQSFSELKNGKINPKIVFKKEKTILQSEWNGLNGIQKILEDSLTKFLLPLIC